MNVLKAAIITAATLMVIAAGFGYSAMAATPTPASSAAPTSARTSTATTSSLATPTTVAIPTSTLVAPTNVQFMHNPNGGATITWEDRSVGEDRYQVIIYINGQPHVFNLPPDSTRLDVAPSDLDCNAPPIGEVIPGATEVMVVALSGVGGSGTRLPLPELCPLPIQESLPNGGGDQAVAATGAGRARSLPSTGSGFESDAATPPELFLAVALVIAGTCVGATGLVVVLSKHRARVRRSLPNPTPNPRQRLAAADQQQASRFQNASSKTPTLPSTGTRGTRGASRTFAFAPESVMLAALAAVVAFLIRTRSRTGIRCRALVGLVLSSSGGGIRDHRRSLARHSRENR